MAAPGRGHTRVFLTGALALCLLALPAPAFGDLRSPAWYDEGGVETPPDWHFRVPVNVPGPAAEGATIRVDVDFYTLLDRLGVSGTFDTNSPRVVRADGTLVPVQQYTDSVYGAVTDLRDNGRGEIRFLLADNGPVTYQLYFDILENGAKAAWDVNDTINGNFEFSADGQQNPPGWSGSATAAYDARVIENSVVTQQNMRMVSTDAGSPGAVYTDESAASGGFCYLLGARERNEAATANPSSSLTRGIDVPVANPGMLLLRYRIKGWDGSADYAERWDYLRIYISSGGATRELVGPMTGAYTSFPFSPNLGTNLAANNQSGYGRYNGWDTDLMGRHRSGMSLAPGAEPAPWFQVSADLGAFAGQTITLTIATRNQILYKSWFHIDDVQWSRFDATLGDPEGFGANILSPADTAAGPADVYNPGDQLVIRVQADAGPAAGGDPVTADVRDPANTSVVSAPIILFDDGTHGDATANDGTWTNDGSIPGEPTYTFLVTDIPGTTWRVIVFARDASDSTLNAVYNGLVHIPDQPAQPDQADYYNIDQQVFTFISLPNIALVKRVAPEEDPVNGSTNPKAIPGAALLYSITASNQGGGATDSNSLVFSDAIAVNTSLFVGDLDGAGSGPVVFLDGGVPSGLTYSFLGLSSSLDNLTFLDAAMAPMVPAPGPDGYDSAVRYIRVAPDGVFNGINGTSIPSFSLRFRVRVN